MTQNISSGALEVYGPDSPKYDPKVTVPAGHFETASVSQRMQDMKDAADFVISNRYGRYGGEITSGDRVTFTISGTSGSAYGDGVYDEGPYGSGSQQWVGIVRNVTYTQVDAQESVLEVETSDYVYTILGWRQVYDTFEGREVAGTDSAILDTVLRNRAPEIDRGRIAEVRQQEDMFMSGTGLLDVTTGLAARADALVASAGRSLIFEPLGDQEPRFTLQPHDYQLPASVKFNDDDLVNDLRVDGGSDYTLDDEQSDTSSTATVTQDSRTTAQISTRKSQIDRVEIWTPDSHDGDGDSLVVRLQKDDGGQPVAVGEQKSDIASKQLSSEFLANNDWVSFLMPEHTLPEPNPWVIVESNGEDGQPVGTDSSGNLAYRAHYPYSVAVRVEDRGSQNEYMRRQDKVKNDNLSTFNAARAAGQARVNRRNEPAKEIEFSAESDRAHALAPGDVVRVEDFAKSGVSGDFIVTQRDDEIPEDAPHIMETDIVAREINTL